MTPAALTPAAARQAKRPTPASGSRSGAAPRSAGASRTSSARSAGHRPASRPASPRPAGAAARPRRVSGPAQPQRAPRRPAPRPARSLPSLRPRSLSAQAAAFVRSLPTHRLLDRVVRGRAWIPLLGLLLAGIVAMQVEILKLSHSTGRSLESVTTLQSRNEQLRADVAVLGDDQRIERLAAGMGMVMPGPSQVRFLSGGPANVGRALNAIQAPNATTFLANLPSAQTPAAAATSGATQTALAPTTSTPTVTTGPSATNTGVVTSSAPVAGAATGTGVAASPVPVGSGTPSPNGAAGVPTGG
ncbi:MAG TPA: hypothetical protein VFN55_18175 [Solirubrobacteraceae bacterium]|nr:hypothetical protein [Solirubrobacteraceae bacterium]